MLERRELKDQELMFLSMKLPLPLYEFYRNTAFREKKTISLLIQEALEKFRREKEGQENGGSASIK
jgi:hypothetical protein